MRTQNYHAQPQANCLTDVPPSTSHHHQTSSKITEPLLRDLREQAYAQLPGELAQQLIAIFAKLGQLSKLDFTGVDQYLQNFRVENQQAVAIAALQHANHSAMRHSKGFPETEKKTQYRTRFMLRFTKYIQQTTTSENMATRTQTAPPQYQQATLLPPPLMHANMQQAYLPQAQTLTTQPRQSRRRTQEHYQQHCQHLQYLAQVHPNYLANIRDLNFQSLFNIASYIARENPAFNPAANQFLNHAREIFQAIEQQAPINKIAALSTLDNFVGQVFALPNHQQAQISPHIPLLLLTKDVLLRMPENMSNISELQECVMAFLDELQQNMRKKDVNRLRSMINATFNLFQNMSTIDSAADPDRAMLQGMQQFTDEAIQGLPWLMRGPVRLLARSQIQQIERFMREE